MNEEQYHKIRGIIRGEIAHFTCDDCKRQTPENYPCECSMLYFGMRFKPTEKYIDHITDKIRKILEETTPEELDETCTRWQRVTEETKEEV